MSDANGRGPQWRREFTIGHQTGDWTGGLDAFAEAVERGLRPVREPSARPGHGGPGLGSPEPRVPAFDKEQVAAVASLIAALRDCRDAVVSLGPLVVVKSGDWLRVHSFTPDEERHLHPAVLTSAPDLMALIDRLTAARSQPTDARPDGRHRRP
ncbi:hypothetical protein [Glycomyces harbinensis]|uniref:Uncharacterized protein n=1 Tax=Glycomyces harbinensis TaxID=58114 RepID=A0A1G6YJB2_9ACTN|nr:hypothetical protein [Glycomyces harbinensis]SDD90382.1 hypothetical protein SAMN05216270_10928 [Glycomyces harbinensis]